MVGPGRPPKYSNNSKEMSLSSGSVSTVTTSAVSNNNPPTASSSPMSTSTGTPAKSHCVWCREAKQTLKYVLPTQHGKKEFCSEICLAEFRRAYNKQGACSYCDNVIRTPPIKLEMGTMSKEFCSKECLNKFQNRGLQKAAISPGPMHTNPNTSSTSSPISVTIKHTPPPTPPAESMVKKNATKYPTSPGNFTVEMNSDFNVETYVKEAGARLAPAYCFKQHLRPPLNEFKPGMKLEAIDPRNTTSTCIATVIATLGPRLRLRLDGTDNSNDFWRLVDSEEISPIGHCEAKGGILQPPLGFRKNASFWKTFLIKTLNGAERASARCFKPPPPIPKGNYFKVGMKLEAVDRKNPHMICIATIGAINGENIHISFDGWRGAFDYWTRYDDRDIFPVGWCSMSGHPIQGPGQKGPPIHPIEEDENQAIININKTCYLGPHLDRSKVSELVSTYGPKPIDEMYRESMQLILDCCIDPKMTSSWIKQGNGKPVQAGKTRLKLQSMENSQMLWNELREFLRNIKCCEGFIMDGECKKCTSTSGSASPTNVAKKRHGSTDHKEVIESKKPLVSSSEPNKGPVPPTPPRSSTNNTSSSSVNYSNTALSTNNKNSHSPSPSVSIRPNISISISTPKPETQSRPVPPPVQPCYPVTQPKPEIIPSCPTPTFQTNGSSASASSSTQSQQLPLDPSDWGIEEVIQYIVSQDQSMAVHGEVFRRHEIDGRAMLLLNPDTMMKYMELRLGPALKICNIISKLKNMRRFPISI